MRIKSGLMVNVAPGLAVRRGQVYWAPLAASIVLRAAAMGVAPHKARPGARGS